MDSQNPRCIGWFWNFANTSARDYYVEKVVLPLATATTIDGALAHRGARPSSVLGPTA
jgi:hypothetical protein